MSNQIFEYLPLNWDVFLSSIIRHFCRLKIRKPTLRNLGSVSYNLSWTLGALTPGNPENGLIKSAQYPSWLIFLHISWAAKTNCKSTNVQVLDWVNFQIIINILITILRTFSISSSVICLTILGESVKTVTRE